MNYTETVDFLYSQLPVYQRTGSSAYKEGLDNSLLLDKQLNYPHKKYKTLHIAGTNGKGSTSHLLAAVLQQSGYRTGLYTSPHLLDFRERIRINGEMIKPDFVVDFVEQMLDTIACIHPSFFELTMMLAFMYFAEEKVDIAVIETGLGGRLDSTNIISPELVVITNISFDHTQFLGNTLPEIAAEKAGIIKPHIPVVIGEAGNSAVRHVFETKASEVNARICFAEDMPKVLSAEIKSGYQIFQTTDYPNLTCGLTGFYQQKNANTVLTVIEKLKSINITIPDVAVYEGFKDVQPLTSLAGRWQKLQDNPCVICDTGHNEAGIEFVIKQLKSMKYSKLRIVFGLVNDKDTAKIIALLPDDAVYYFTKASVQRALDEEELHRIASTRGLCGMAYPSVCHAIRNALHDSDSDNLVFIGGSNFIVADALLYYESEKSIS